MTQQVTYLNGKTENNVGLRDEHETSLASKCLCLMKIPIPLSRFHSFQTHGKTTVYAMIQIFLKL